MGKFSWKMFAGSILAGALYGMIGEVLYPVLIENVSSILTTFLYFTGLFLFLGIAVYLIGKFVYSHTYQAVNKKQWLCTFLLIMVLSVLFEFLYNLFFRKDREAEFQSCLFLIDNSGSMEESDPEGVRYQAINKILEDEPENFQYGVYCFSDDVSLVREIASKSSGNDYNEPDNLGGTAIMGLFTTVKSDMESGKLKAWDGCRIILLSDGCATDIDMSNKYSFVKLLNEFSAKGVSVSTVGLKYADDELMGMIAEKTGGVYISVDDIGQLEGGMREAVQNNDIKRNLLGYRSDGYAGLFLGLMRILFVAALGLVTAVQKTVLCEKFLDTRSVLASSVAGGILAGVCIEVGINLFGISPTFVRILTCVLIAFTLLREDLFIRGTKDMSVKYAGG